MAVFKNIHISKFRGIRDLDVTDLKNINVFLGGNNVGKTTILEAFFLLTGMSNPTLPMRINNLRSKRLFADSAIGQNMFLFYNVDTKNNPVFEANMSNDDFRRLSISLSDKQNTEKALLPNYVSVASSDEKHIGAECVVLNFEIKGKNDKTSKRYKSEFCTLNNGNVQQSISNNYQEQILAQFIASSADPSTLTANISELIKAGKKSEIVELIKLFDNRIVDLEALIDSVYIKYQGVKNLLPIDMCGEGLKKFLYIITGVANGKNDILLIDEIENGIHFSAYSLLWKSIFELARKNKLQIMITTHSKEVLTYLTTAINEELLVDACLYSITKGADENLYSYRYSGMDIVSAVDNNLELRD